MNKYSISDENYLDDLHEALVDRYYESPFDEEAKSEADYLSDLYQKALTPSDGFDGFIPPQPLVLK